MVADLLDPRGPRSTLSTALSRESFLLSGAMHCNPGSGSATEHRTVYRLGMHNATQNGSKVGNRNGRGIRYWEREQERERATRKQGNAMQTGTTANECENGNKVECSAELQTLFHVCRSSALCCFASWWPPHEQDLACGGREAGALWTLECPGPWARAWRAGGVRLGGPTAVLRLAKDTRCEEQW